MHEVFRNMLPPEAAKRSVKIRVIDNNGRATRAGAEVRVYAKGAQQVLATRLVDAGSGYNAQGEVPVSIGLAQVQPVDIEITFPRAGKRVTSKLTLEAKDWQTGPVIIRVPGP
jgi:hypothetical protein